MKIKALGIPRKSSSGKILDVSFPYIEFNDEKIGDRDINNENLINYEWDKSNLDASINDTESAYLKLHLISHKFCKPNSINLDGIFNALPNVVWTNIGPVDIDEIDQLLTKSKIENLNVYVRSIDKFPCLTDYVIPKNVRIADASRVRLGAYLSEGTTIMHEGFVNFNAGTMGSAMIEGRISAGVIIGNGSDLGGGSSTMGTLSGGNNIKISLGENSLIGANAGLGIPLGDNCIVEAGLYLTAGTKIALLNEKNGIDSVLKGLELAGASNILFYRDSQTGKVVAKANKKPIQLNETLHTNE